MTLALPSLRGQPREFTFTRGCGSKVLRLARILEEIGFITAKPPFPSPSKLIQESFTAWAERCTGGLNVFSGAYVVVNAEDVSPFFEMIDQYHAGADVKLPKPDDAAIFAFCPWSFGKFWHLERRCAAIEARYPGLAETALHAVNRGLWRTLHSMTPQSAVEMIERYDWDQEQDENSPVKALQKLPKWVIAPRSRLKANALKRIPSPVAAAVFDLQQALADGRALTPDTVGYFHASFAAVLCWNASDQITRIADDYVNDAQSGGEATDDYSFHCLALERRPVEKWIDAAGRMLRTLGCADRLISLLAEPA